MKRQTVTLSRRFLELCSDLNSEDRLNVYDKIFDHLFNGNPIEMSNDSDACRVAFGCLAPELRRLQTCFDNGKISKKLSTSTKGLLCPFDGSKTEATSKPSGRPIDNQLNQKNNIITNINNHINQLNQESNNNYNTNTSNIYNNIYNTQGAAESDTQNYTFDDIIKQGTPTYIDALKQILQKIQPINAIVALRTAECLHELVKSESIKIKGQDYKCTQVLKTIYQNVRTLTPDELTCVLVGLYEEVDSRKVNNKTRYEIMSLFKLSTRIKKKFVSEKMKQNNHEQRNISAEQHNSVFDDLDDCVIE